MARRPLTIDQTKTEQFTRVDATMRIAEGPKTLAFPEITIPAPPSLPTKTVSTVKAPHIVVPVSSRRPSPTWGQIWRREIHARDFRIYLGVLTVVSAVLFATIMILNRPPQLSPRQVAKPNGTISAEHPRHHPRRLPVKPSHRLSTGLKHPIPVVTPTPASPGPQKRRHAPSKPSTSPSHSVKPSSPSPSASKSSGPSKTPDPPPTVTTKSASPSQTASNSGDGTTPTPTVTVSTG